MSDHPLTPSPRHPFTARHAPALDQMTSRSLIVRAKSADEKTRSVDAVLATGNVAQVFDDQSFEVIDEILDIEGFEMGGGSVPMLADHNHYEIEKIRGSVRNVRIEKGELVGTLVFASDPASVEAFNKVRDGHITDVSAGYQPTVWQDVAPNSEQDIDGKKFSAGNRTLRLTRKWTLKEVSLVPIGADPASKIRRTPRRQGAPHQPQETRAMDPNKEQMDFLRSLGLADDADADATRTAIDALTDEQRAEFDGMASRADEGMMDDEEDDDEQEDDGKKEQADRAAASVGTITRKVDAKTIRERAARAERNRLTRIDELAEMAGTVDKTIVARAKKDGWSVERAMRAFRTASRDALAPAANGSIVVTERQQDLQRQAVTYGLMQRCGVQPAIKDEAMLRESRQYARCGIQQIAQIALRMENKPFEPHWDPDSLFRRSISTFSFAEILGNTFSKILMQAYDESPDTVSEWASIESVRDFKTVNFLKLGKFASVPKVGAGGELEHSTLVESKETGSAATYGVVFAFTRRDFINDDLGAFSRVPLELGAAARRNIQDIVYDLLISASGVGPTMNEDSKALFATDHTDGVNYQTGAGSVLQSSSLITAKKNLRRVKQSGAYLNLSGHCLLVPAALEHTAKELVESSEILIYGQTSATVRGNKNTHQGSLHVVAEPRLDDATNGATAWYLTTPPAQARSIAVMYLNGQQTPVVERADPPRTVRGRGGRRYPEVGAAAGDWRGINRPTGA